MDTATLIVDEFANRQLLEDSPYFEGMKFGDIPAISADRLNDVVVEEIRDCKNNIIEFWQPHRTEQPEIISIDDDEECGGPLNEILRSFKAHSKHPNDNYDNDDSPFSSENRQSPQSYELDDIISCSDRNFEDVINEQPRWVGAQCNSIEAYRQACQSDRVDADSRSKQNKRDKKLSRKLNCDKGKLNKVSESVHKHSASGSKVERTQSNNDLIIKISCCSDKTAGSNKADLTVNRQTKTDVKLNLEADDKLANECSSSTSTSGKEKDEAALCCLSDCKESFIELDTQTKIFCRAVGPLNADQRKSKVQHYFDKKRTRKWTKRINYTTRKQVADVRPRYKGRFVTEQQFQAFDEMERHKRQMKALQKVFIITKCYPKSK